MIGTRSLPRWLWLLTIPASFVATHAANEPPVRIVPPTLSPADPGDVETWKGLVGWLTNSAGHCDLEPVGDFGHDDMTLPDLIAHLRERVARTSRLDDVNVSTSELTAVLDAAERGSA